MWSGIRERIFCVRVRSTERAARTRTRTRTRTRQVTTKDEQPPEVRSLAWLRCCVVCSVVKAVGFGQTAWLINRYDYYFIILLLFFGRLSLVV